MSRAEHFEVITVHNNSFDGNRSSAASMLAKQIRLKLVADDDSDIPRPYRNIMVSIHAIATFKALDDYLRPRIIMTDRPRGARHREGMSNALAAFAAAAGLPIRMIPSATAAHSRAAPPHPHPPRRPCSRRGGAVAPPRSTPAGRRRPCPNRAPVRGRSDPPARDAPAGVIVTPPPPPPPPPMPATAPDPDHGQDPLECADEKAMDDDDDDDDEALDDAEALDAIVDDVDEDMDDESIVDPTAVNLEVASTGKVTARKEDGTRVATPSQAPGAAAPPPSGTTTTMTPTPAAASTPSSTLASASRHLSYAAAMQAIPQDWHVEFSIDGKPIANETTIYRAVHQHQTHLDEAGLRASGRPCMPSNSTASPVRRRRRPVR